MVRLILIFLFIVIVLLLSIPVQLVLWLIGLARPDIRERVSLVIVSRAFGVIAFLAGAKVQVKGRENIPENEGVLYVGNHRSYFDIVVTYADARAPMGFISKKQVRKVPILNIWMIFLNCLFLDRDDIKQGLEVINKAVELVKNGTSMVIYPEGTRNKTDEILQPFHRGSFKIAQKAGCKIIPVTVTRTEELYEAHKPFVRKADITLTYGKPIDLAAMDVKERRYVDTLVKEAIETTYRENMA